MTLNASEDTESTKTNTVLAGYILYDLIYLTLEVTK